jgi:hypothetical protein
MTLLSFDGNAVPVNKEKVRYPTWYSGRDEGGEFTSSLNAADAVSGKSLQLELTKGALYAQFNPYDGTTRGFARDYCADPKNWQFDTYNRFRFWIKAPASAPPHRKDGRVNMNVGTYYKSVSKPDRYSDEAGGGHSYHGINVPATDTWTQVILNMHPDHFRGASGGEEHGNQPHPTGEEKYNYFDALTRFYIQVNEPPSKHPATYLMDEFEFYQEANQENEEQILSLTATYIPSQNRLIVCWGRNKNENKVRHEVRYSFSDVHKTGWQSATAAPRGIIQPPGEGGYNQMVYDTTGILLKNRSTVYVAIKPENSKKFTQIAIPLNQGSADKD